MWVLKPSLQVMMPLFSFAQQKGELVMYQCTILNVWLIPCAGTEISMTWSKDCSIQCSCLSHHNGAVKEVSHIQYLLRCIVKIMNSEYSRLGWEGGGGKGERQVPFQLERFTFKSCFAHITGRRQLNTGQHSRSKPLKRLPVCISYGVG